MKHKDSLAPSRLVMAAAALGLALLACTALSEPAGTTGWVWVDKNGDGFRDAGESGMPAVTVNLYDSEGLLLDTATTEADGRYRFESLPDGEYYIEVVAPDGFSFSPQDRGNDDSQDSDVSPQTGLSPITDLRQVGYDAGLMPAVAAEDTPAAEPTAPPAEAAALSGIHAVTAAVKEDEAGLEPVIQLLRAFTLIVVQENSTLSFDGFEPFVDVSGPVESDGSFTATGTGTVAGIDDVLVTFQGSINEKGLSGDYTMGGDGRLTDGLPIVYSLEGNRVGPPPDDTPPGSLVKAQGFYDEVGADFDGGNLDGLLFKLHPVVIDLYGVDQCRTYLETVIQNPIRVEVLEVIAFSEWTWERDNQQTVVPSTYTLQVLISAADESVTQESHLAERMDGSLGWFTDCGDPLPLN